MSSTVQLASVVKRLAWSNLAAQSAEQIGLAAAPTFAVLALGAGTGEAGFLQTAQTLPFLLISIPAEQFGMGRTVHAKQRPTSPR
jgi:hypothetical protein